MVLDPEKIQIEIFLYQGIRLCKIDYPVDSNYFSLLSKQNDAILNMLFIYNNM
jgi:hypothetical protein